MTLEDLPKVYIMLSGGEILINYIQVGKDEFFVYSLSDLSHYKDRYARMEQIR